MNCCWLQFESHIKKTRMSPQVSRKNHFARDEDGRVAGAVEREAKTMGLIGLSSICAAILPRIRLAVPRVFGRLSACFWRSIAIKCLDILPPELRAMARVVSVTTVEKAATISVSNAASDLVIFLRTFDMNGSTQWEGRHHLNDPCALK